MARTSGLSPNLNAFLDAIAVSELGAAILAESDDGYNVLEGSMPGHVLTFASYAQHPNVLEPATSSAPASTAAGRYQILHHWAVAYSAQLGLPDFGPESQDSIAIQMIGECHARDDIEAGNIKSALVKCNSRWASLPGSQYGQHVNKLNSLLAAYQSSGGQTAEA